MIQCFPHADYPGWQQAVGVPSAAGIDYLIGEDGQRGRGIGSAAIAAFTAVVFGLYPDVDSIVSVPQRDMAMSRARPATLAPVPGMTVTLVSAETACEILHKALPRKRRSPTILSAA